MACPICGRTVAPRPGNPAFPFCSPACKLVDLGRWLDGTYRIPGGPARPDDGLGERPDGAGRGDESDRDGSAFSGAGEGAGGRMR